MPGAQIDNALVLQFSDMVHVAAQQIRARTKPYVQIKKMTGDLFAYDGRGTIEVQEVLGRIQPTQFSEINHTRRKISRVRYSATIAIDESDSLAVLIDPSKDYSRDIVMAMERQWDRIVTAAAFADVYTGRDFDTTVNFATDGGLTVNATAGLTYEKLLEIKQNFIDNDVGTDVKEQIVFLGSGDEHTALMKESELTSGDFSRQFVVDKGEIVKVIGMDALFFAANAVKPILNVTSAVRSNIAMTSRAICMGVSQEMKVEISPRPDYIGVTQVQVRGIMGAVRTEGKLIQKVTTTE